MRAAIDFGTTRQTGIVPLSHFRAVSVLKGPIKGRNSVVVSVYKATVNDGKIGIGAVSYPYDFSNGSRDPRVVDEVVVTKSATINCVVARNDAGEIVDVDRGPNSGSFVYKDGSIVPRSKLGHLFYRGNLAGRILELHRAGNTPEEISQDLVSHGHTATPGYVQFVLMHHLGFNRDTKQHEVRDRLNDSVLDVNDSNGAFAHRAIQCFFDDNAPVNNAGLQRIIPPIFYQTTEQVPIRSDWLESLILANCRSKEGIIESEYISQPFVVNGIFIDNDDENNPRIIFDILLVEALEDEEGETLYRAAEEAAVSLPWIEGITETLVSPGEETYEEGDYINSDDVYTANTRICSVFPEDPVMASARPIVEILESKPSLKKAVEKLLFEVIRIQINGISAFRVDMLESLPADASIRNLFFITAGPDSKVEVVNLPNGNALRYESPILKIDLYHHPWFDRDRKNIKKVRNQSDRLTEHLQVPTQ